MPSSFTILAAYVCSDVSAFPSAAQGFLAYPQASIFCNTKSVCPIGPRGRTSIQDSQSGSQPPDFACARIGFSTTFFGPLRTSIYEDRPRRGAVRRCVKADRGRVWHQATAAVLLFTLRSGAAMPEP